MKNNHFDNITLIVCNIYTAWFLIVTNLLSIITSKTHSFDLSFWMSIFGIVIFSPILYKYYITQTTDVWDRPKG